MTSMDAESEYRTFLYIYEKQGVHAVAERYGRNVRTMQRWKKAERIPESALRPAPSPQKYQQWNESYKLAYNSAKQKKGGLKAFAKKLGVSESTVRRWEKKGIPKTSKGKFEKAKRKIPLKKRTAISKKNKRGQVKNAIHGVVKIGMYRNGQYSDFVVGTKVYKLSSRNMARVTQDRLKLENTWRMKMAHQYNATIDILYSHNATLYVKGL